MTLVSVNLILAPVVSVELVEPSKFALIAPINFLSAIINPG